MYRRKRVYAKGSERSRSTSVKRSKAVTVQPMRGVLGRTSKAKFIYHESFQLNPGVAGIPAGYIFSANGVFDPNITGVGHQPRGFDQVMTMYDHCVVTKVKATVFVENTDTTHSTILTVLANDSPTAYTQPDDILEHPYQKTLIIANKGSGPNVRSMSYSFDPNKFLGRKSPLSDPDLKNSTSSNPTEQAYIHVYAAPGSSSSDSNTNYCRIILEYEATLIEPKLPSAS